MADMEKYASYAVLQELNRREFRKKLEKFPAELRHYVILAAGIIGAENATRVAGTPEAVVEDGQDFAAELLDIVSPGQDDAFKSVLETYLIETMKDELRFCCSNCLNFYACLDLDNVEIGHRFKLCAEDKGSDDLKKEIALQIDGALQKTPYLETESAETLCRRFRHQYSPSMLAEIFNRYADIAAGLQQTFGIDYRLIQQEMIALNMEFCARSYE